MKLYFKTTKNIREFYWITIGKDQSVYFGSLVPFKKGYKGESAITVATEGKTVEYKKEGIPMDSDEIKNKHSFHKSGILIMPTKEKGLRKRYNTMAFSEYKFPMPLVGILPMKISTYPLAKKALKKEDMIIDVSDFEKQPFGTLLYLKNTDQEDPQIVKNKETWDKTLMFYGKLGLYELCIFIYTNVTSFKKWPNMQITCLAHPDPRSKEIHFPIFSNLF